jgi:hypothetical protein
LRPYSPECVVGAFCELRAWVVFCELRVCRLLERFA